MDRYIKSSVLADLDKKIVLISGPRQVGKTTLSKNLKTHFEYMNYDYLEDRILIKEKSWRRDVDLVIFDEIHKMSEWKRWLKGIYDREQNKPNIVVTGSANLESYSKVGDSLAGRYFPFRLHPIDIREAMIIWKEKPEESFNKLMVVGGFPEPYIKEDETYYRRWQRTHLDIILKQDLLDLKTVKSLKSIETLIAILATRVGSNIAFANIARDLEVDPKTIKEWMRLLENLYAIFLVPPYHKNIARALLKEPKCYFFDNGRVVDKPGMRLENLVACALKKACHFFEDTQGKSAELFYMRTKDGLEIDFLITIDKQPFAAFEIKTSETEISKAFAHFQQYIRIPHQYQLVNELSREKDFMNGVKVRNLVNFLANLDLAQMPVIRNWQII